MRSTVLAIFAALSLFAQFDGLAVTDDGRLFFSTTLTTDAEDARSKIFRVTSGGVELFATGPGTRPNGPSAVSPVTSGDGGITAYAIFTPCETGSCASPVPRTTYQFQGVNLSPTPYERLQISRNGRYLFGYTASIANIIDLRSGQIHMLPINVVPGGSQMISNDGAVVYQGLPDRHLPLLYKPLDEVPRPIAGTENGRSVIISPDGHRVVYELEINSEYQLIATDPQGSAHRVLAITAIGTRAPWPVSVFRYRPTFANDGTLLFLSPDRQAMVAKPGADPVLLTTVESGVENAIISGNGQLAWVVTYLGQLLRVRIENGDADEFISETPYLYNDIRAALPGSVIRVTGSGITQRTRFELDGINLPISERTNDTAAAQIPWGYSPQPAAVSFIVKGPEGPFFQRFAYSVLTKPTVKFEVTPFTRNLQAAHQDFRGIVTKEDPALPGETLHIFASSLGPVDRPVTTGQKSPIAPPARVTTPLACYLLEDSASPAAARAVDVPFAGLSGGSIGIYQIDVTIPADWEVPSAIVQCRMDGGTPGIFNGDGGTLTIRTTARTHIANHPHHLYAQYLRNSTSRPTRSHQGRLITPVWGFNPAALDGLRGLPPPTLFD